MSKRAIIIPVVVLVVAAALLFTIKGCWTSWEGGRAEQRTDDAYRACRHDSPEHARLRNRPEDRRQ